jgi:hypothetical protein
MAMTEGKCASQTTPLPIFAPSKRKEQHDDNSPLIDDSPFHHHHESPHFFADWKRDRDSPRISVIVGIAIKNISRKTKPNQSRLRSKTKNS